MAKDDFPMDLDGMDFLQKMIHQVYKLAELGGGNYILSGCTEADGIVSDGHIVIDGELLEFKGGQKQDYILIVENKETIYDEEEEYPEAYISRYATFANEGKLKWDDFQKVLSHQDIDKILKDITGDAPGTVKMWAGMESKIPKDYMLCDGRVLSKDEYPLLFDNIGFTHGLEGVSGFKLPNLQGRFVVGFDNQHEDYKTIGNKGGVENVTLTVDQLASHKHIMPWGENPSTAWNPQWGYAPPPYNQAMRGSNSNDGDNSWAYSSDVGENKPHENRPPFYTLAYIIKVK